MVEIKFVRKMSQVFRRLATQRKSTQFDRKSTVYARNSRPFATCVNLRVDLRIRLATLRKSARKFWFYKRIDWLASTCESVWPGLKNRKGLRTQHFRKSSAPCRNEARKLNR